MAATTAPPTRGATTATSLPSLATYSGSSPSNSHAPRTRIVNRDGAFLDLDAHAPIARRSRSACWPAPPRVGSRMQRIASAPAAANMASTSVWSGAESLATSLSSSSPSRSDRMAMPWSPMAAAQNHRIARPRLARGKMHAVAHQADARGIDVDAVARAALHHFRVAGDDGHAGARGGLRHGVGDAPQIGHGKAFFQNEGRAQKQRTRAAHRQVVDRAMHRQRADIAAAERTAASPRRNRW